ncbi:MULTISPECIES: TIGR03085 family metal-binding protein [unclassified Mycolicibacterium]|uniref:TIGR03085 family metal-binding protein n=1 Tax=unclassified Mycolicibacterium TaxID=2636767 RepID=UPI0012DD4765|nr:MULTISPECIES: TIGR03085 family metal-binding protein [unclassified Mycolicibacterium]MUL82039.1 TIGR03085 family protein [Mycolicibacterium sp. CBMA 329]MUL87805.1 TIGR03085 family protein [Mycolicibacterium sp. CBMA 331]MUM01629.1 TIGR03085 family protein [Mycolicibacterium sp. CBMA 334]MUM25538.1 TIGR03085 family protein [Mycolicibacterium sp. CBMA 295]MUM38102.1 TIGR03085 family protein [Mycolicibacterium sp. CBMA 247]
MSVAQRERAALVESMRAAGPDAPTLCEGWTTRDLAAHLVVRERRLDAAPGILVPQLAGYTERVQRKVTEGTDWAELVDQIAAGPPLYSPFKLLDPLVNVAEMFIHNEDVRRAQPDWEPRALDDATASALSRGIGAMARMTMGKSPARVALTTPEGKTLATVGAGPAVTVTGEPGELLMFAAGREPARVTFSGHDAAVAALRAARRGL